MLTIFILYPMLLGLQGMLGRIFNSTTNLTIAVYQNVQKEYVMLFCLQIVNEFLLLAQKLLAVWNGASTSTSTSLGTQIICC